MACHTGRKHWPMRFQYAWAARPRLCLQTVLYTFSVRSLTTVFSAQILTALQGSPYIRRREPLCSYAGRPVFLCFGLFAGCPRQSPWPHAGTPREPHTHSGMHEGMLRYSLDLSSAHCSPFFLGGGTFPKDKGSSHQENRTDALWGYKPDKHTSFSA